MKDKAKHIFALSGVFICILVLLSNIIFTIANAETMSIYDRMYMLYQFAVNDPYHKFKEIETDDEKLFLYSYYINDCEQLLILRYNGDIEYNGQYAYSTSGDELHHINIQSWGQIVYDDGIIGNSGYVNGDNEKCYIDSNADRGTVFTNDYDNWKNFFTLNNDNVIGGIPLQMNEITFEHYYNKLSDLSHDITITNNSSRDIYYTLRCIMPQNMAAVNSYEHLMYMYKEKQEYNGIASIKYNQLVSSSAGTAAEWISQYFSSQAVLNDYNLTQNEIYNNLMSDTAFWHRTNIYTSGTVGLPYMTAYNISQSEMGAESEHNAIIETLNNNVINVSYTVDGYSSGNVFENSSIIKLSAGETKSINIPQKYMSLNNGVFYQWVLSVGENAENITEHSRKGFTATTSNVGVIPPDNIGSDKYVYDEQGNIIGEFDENGNIVIFDNNNNNTPSLDVPQFDTTSFKGIVSSVGEVVQMSYKMLPPEVYAIIAFGLGVVLAIGIIRLVTG